jgi:hypothetical protein
MAGKIRMQAVAGWMENLRTTGLPRDTALKRRQFNDKHEKLS